VSPKRQWAVGCGRQQRSLEHPQNPLVCARCVWFGPNSAQSATQIIHGMCWDGDRLCRARSGGSGGFVGRGRLVSAAAELRRV